MIITTLFTTIDIAIDTEKDYNFLDIVSHYKIEKKELELTSSLEYQYFGFYKYKIFNNAKKYNYMIGLFNDNGSLCLDFSYNYIPQSDSPVSIFRGNLENVKKAFFCCNKNHQKIILEKLPEELSKKFKEF